MAEYLQPLQELVKNAPEWIQILDDLSSSLIRRQQELAATEGYAPPAKSLKNKGSTESMRPKENDNNIPEGAEPELLASPGELSSTTNAISATSITPGVIVPNPTMQKSSPMPLRKTSLRKKPLPPNPPMIRKRKTESLASDESVKPKNRTRSMIIVYYDSQVQYTFEDLVRKISLARNAMRKGKMQLRMASMRRAAQLESETGNVLEVDDQADDGLLVAPSGENAEDLATGGELPPLKYRSTRRMGPTRDSGIGRGVTQPIPRMGGRTVAGLTRESSVQISVFDELDTSLEWCQSMCEHAAHQFLRDGACKTEIENIKTRMVVVKERAEMELGNAGPGATRKVKAEVDQGGEIPPLTHADSAMSVDSTEGEADGAATPNLPATPDILRKVDNSENPLRYTSPSRDDRGKVRTLRPVQMRARSETPKPETPKTPEAIVQPLKPDDPMLIEADDDEEDEADTVALEQEMARKYASVLVKTARYR
jgi:hypothetical protein